jgi:hypothetical protein
MIPREKEFKLIVIYMYICDLYDNELKFYCHRYSNNANPAFTDQEIMTIYLFTGYCQKYFRINCRKHSGCYPGVCSNHSGPMTVIH